MSAASFTPLSNLYLILVVTKEGEHKLLSKVPGELEVFSTDSFTEATAQVTRLNYTYFPNTYKVVQLVEVQS